MKTDRSNSEANSGGGTIDKKNRLLSLVRHHVFSLGQTVLGFNMISEIASAYGP